ncbi:MAG: hypothetical protein HQL66_13560 [Magnetococcales bacterium]|nr:hypothetical protein [Magnetococcales bacterium]
MSNTTSFSAVPSFLGYLYQCRLALLIALKRIPKGDEFQISIETLDDVVFESVGAPLELLQSKHQIKRHATLTNASPDLWKTLRVWCEGWTQGSIPEGSILNLFTTAYAPDGSAASYLRDGQGRNEESALRHLHTTAATSVSDENRKGYQAFQNLGENERKRLISSIVVLDAQPTIADLDDEFRAIICYAVEKKYRDSFLDRMEGWWFREVIKRMTSPPDRTGILSGEIESKMGDLREQFKRDALPVDDDIFQFEVDDTQYNDSIFVHQMRLIDAGRKRIVAAVREYWRAFEQRSRWIREDLLLAGELERYEQRLLEEWELAFAQMEDEIGQESVEDVKKKAARALLKQIEDMSIPIRSKVTEAFVSRGSYQILSDQLRVGWHPEFMDRLSHLLQDPGRGA